MRINRAQRANDQIRFIQINNHDLANQMGEPKVRVIRHGAGCSDKCQKLQGAADFSPFPIFPAPYAQRSMILRTLRFFLDLVLGAAVWVFVVPWCWLVLMQTWNGRVLRGPPPDEYALLAGLLLGLVLMFWRKPNLFLHTWLHENAHALMCVLLWVRVGSISATSGQGGETRHEPIDPLRAVPILIAPYVLPLVLGPLLLGRWLCPAGTLQAILTFTCGLGIWLHLHGLWLNLRLNSFGKGADIPRVGHLLSYALVACSLLLLAAACVVVLYSSQPPLWWSRLFAA